MEGLSIKIIIIRKVFNINSVTKKQFAKLNTCWKYINKFNCLMLEKKVCLFFFNCNKFKSQNTQCTTPKFQDLKSILNSFLSHLYYSIFEGNHKLLCWVIFLLSGTNWLTQVSFSMALLLRKILFDIVQLRISAPTWSLSAFWEPTLHRSIY